MQLLSVNYHYIRNEKPKSGIYPLSLKELDRQIDTLARSYEFISQQDLSAIIEKQYFLKKKYCLLTFDDGLKEQLEAFELLKSKGIPAVFYVTTHSIKEQSVVDVHKLHHIRSSITDDVIMDTITKIIGNISFEYPGNIDSLYRYDEADTKKLKYLLNFILNSEQKTRVINELFGSLIADEKKFSTKFYMSKSDIKMLDEYGCLGTHTDKHLPLAMLGKSQIRDEIKQSLLFLQNDCGAQNITSISYPYGGPKAVSNTVAEISKPDFTFGVTMKRGVNGDEDLVNNPLLLKRVDTNDAPGGKLGSQEYCG